MTKSILHFHPRPTDHGKTLTCRAENTELSHAAIEDHWKLVIHCKFLGLKILVQSFQMQLLFCILENFLRSQNMFTNSIILTIKIFIYIFFVKTLRYLFTCIKDHRCMLYEQYFFSMMSSPKAVVFCN